MMQIDPHEMARRRWKMLARALHKNKQENSIADDTVEVSVRRITGFGLVTLIPVEPEKSPETSAPEGAPWFEYSTVIDGQTYCLKVRHLVKDITPVDLMGFNNTGNICVWPSEEVLAYFALCNKELFEDKTVLELGGGMTCLAGLLIAKYTRASYIHLTDGNISSVENVFRIVEENDLGNSPRVTCSVLKWSDKQCRSFDKYDIILAADCLFFDDGRKDLVATMWRCLKQDGTALVTAPRRGNTLNEFLVEAGKAGFFCDAKVYYDEQVWLRHLKLKAESNSYDEDIHYPILIYVNKNNNVTTTPTIKTVTTTSTTTLTNTSATVGDNSTTTKQLTSANNK